MLKFLVDENIRIEVKEFLKSKGIEAKYAQKGIENSEVASLAKKGAISLTLDIHFSDILLYPPEEFAGIVIVRISPSMLEEILSALEKLLKEVKDFSGKLVFLELPKSKVIEGPFEIKP